MLYYIVLYYSLLYYIVLYIYCYIHVVYQPVFASALSFTLPYATSPVCHQPCSTFIWHSVLSESSSHNRFFE